MFDTGNTGFMLLSTSLVMLMTPGLAFFYGGLVGRKNVLAIMMQSFVSMCLTTVLWFLVGYSLCFSGDVGGIIGNLDHAFMRGLSLNDAFAGANNIPLFVFIAYQMMFAIITPALITGAFTNRVRFGAYLVFLVVWLLFVYFPFVHMVWGVGSCRSGEFWISPGGSSSMQLRAWRHWRQSSMSVSAGGVIPPTVFRWSRWERDSYGSDGTVSMPGANLPWMPLRPRLS